MAGPTRAGQQPLAGDPHRPVYHFLPPANWLNDPNGLIHWQGQYHLFYQHNPHGAFHATMHWGHAVSEDLVHWRHLPIALAPEPGTPDEDGCWSGCAVDDNGVPTLIYSGNRDGVQRACLATSTDGLLTWQKHHGNPVIPEPPPELHLVAYRDHSVWREDGAWYHLMGAGLEGQGGTALLYRSADLRTWEYLHPLLVGDMHRFTPIWTASMWECPDFFALDDRHVLIVSVWDTGQLHYSAAMVGNYHDHHLVPEIEHKLDHGDQHFYAPQSFTDAQGRRIIFGWVHEGRGAQEQLASGWSGVMSLPRVLSLSASGHVCMQPAPELAALRAEHMRCDSISVPAGEVVELPDVSGDTLELLVDMAPGPDGSCGLIVRRAPDEAEQTRITYDGVQHQLIVDRTRSSLDLGVDHNSHAAPLTLEPGEPLRLHIFLDHSVLEIFANERVSITSRIYPTRRDSVGVALVAEGADAQLQALDAWQMHSVWEA
ncbi:MAG TPA: glycoside hydrolase family 32 protein [Herpetosiphonaceae bacterium]|nr:glycoside hydrolase family 32 protein [Herpetosiphonaceae bacterium]